MTTGSPSVSSLSGVLRKIIGFAAERLMEVYALTSAGYGDRSLGCWRSATDTATASGEICAGKVELEILKLRKGGYFPRR
jgi:hypothetical protein